MRITLYNNTSEINAINKNLLYIGDLIGTLKQATSLLNPSILIEMDNGEINYDIDVVDENNDELMYLDDAEEIDISVNIDYTIFDANYCYIHEFKRYYFIDNIIIQNNKLFMIQLNVDVLETHKNQFMSLNAFITRNEFQYDPYIQDNQVNFSFDKEVSYEYYEPAHSNPISRIPYINIETFGDGFDYFTHNTIISTMSQYHSGSATPIPGLDESDYYYNYDYIEQNVTGMGIASQYYVTDDDGAWKVLYSTYNDDTLLGFIKNILVFPFNIPHYGSLDYFMIGDTKIKKDNYDDFNIALATYPFLKFRTQSFHITPYYNDFRDYSPYTKYELYIPLYGSVEFYGEDILNHDLHIMYTCNYETGDGTCYVYDSTITKVIFQASCNMCVKVALSATNARELENQKLSATLNTAIGAMSSVISIGAGAVTGNGVAVAGGILGLASTATKAVTAFNEMYHVAQTSSTSGIESLNGSKRPYWKITRAKAINYNNDFNKMYGRPLHKYDLLSNMHGFTSIGDIHLENVNATQTELISIENSLKNGVIIK